MKQFSFFQPAMLPIEGAGYLQGGYSVTINIEEKNIDTGKNIYLSAVGKITKEAQNIIDMDKQDFLKTFYP